MKKLTCITLIFGLNFFSTAQIFIDSTISDKPLISAKINYVQIVNKDNLKVDTFQNILSLHTIVNNQVSQTPVQGKYKLSDSLITFSPNFELDTSLSFLIKSESESRVFKPYLEESRSREVEINSIYPKSIKIPENILTFYIEFNQQMFSDNEAYKAIGIKKSNGDTLTQIWRQNSFWINKNKTLVLMLHPGRVKQNIASTSHLSRLFSEGDTITIFLKNKLKSQHGNYCSFFTKTYYISKKDKVSPFYLNLDNIYIPKHGSSNPIRITFNENIDFGLLFKGISIIDSAGNPIDFSLSSIDDKVWKLVPLRNWTIKKVVLKISSEIGDLSHNQLDRLFEVKSINEIRPTQYRFYEIRFN